MALMHRGPDGTAHKLTRTGPIGTMEGVELTCPKCCLLYTSPSPRD